MGDPAHGESAAETAAPQPLHLQAALAVRRAALLWAHRRRLARLTLAVMLVTAALSLLLRNRYTATVSLMPPEPGSGASLLRARLGASAMASQLGYLPGMRSPGELYLKMMQSRVVQDRLIARFDLAAVYGTRRKSNLRRRLAANTGMAEDRKSGIITVSVTDVDAARAAALANAYAAELDRIAAEVTSSAGRREREYFEAQLLAARQQLEAATRELSDFAGTHAALDVPEQSRALMESAAAIEGQLVAARSELKGLQQIYTDRHERVQQARARIAELERQLERIRGVAGPGGGPHATVKTLSSLATPYADLYRRVKVAEAVVATLAQQYELARLQESRHVADIQVMDPAEAPEKKSSPHRLQLTVGAGLLYLLLACAHILARDRWRRLAPGDPWKSALQPLVTGAAAARSRLRDRWGKAREARFWPWNRS